MPVSAEGAEEATALSGRSNANAYEPWDQMREIGRIIAGAIDRNGDGLPDVDVFASGATQRVLWALSDAGFDIVKRPIGPERAV